MAGGALVAPPHGVVGGQTREGLTQVIVRRLPHHEHSRARLSSRTPRDEGVYGGDVAEQRLDRVLYSLLPDVVRSLRDTAAELGLVQNHEQSQHHQTEGSTQH